MSKKEIVILDLNHWIESFSTFMADEALKVLRAKSQDKGIEAYKALSLSFISRILGTVVLETLQDRPLHIDPNSEEMAAYNLRVFSELKRATQDAVAMAFTVATQHYSRKDIEYYCELKIVPPMISKGIN